MSDVVPQLALVGFLVLLNAVFAGTELALVSLREGQLQRLENQSKAGAAVASVARDPNRFFATIQIGITLAGFLASAAAAVSLSEPLVEPLGFLGGAAEPVAIVVVTILLAYVTLVLGELAPKRVAMQRAERWALLTARPLSFLSKLAAPVVWLLSKSTDIVVRLVGADPNRDREEVTEEELREMVAGQASVTPKQRSIIDGAFEIAERRIDAVLRPRPEVFVLDADVPASAALVDLADSGHSRAPVGVGGGLDEVVGLVHLRDLLDGPDRPVRDCADEIIALPESIHVLTALHRMQNERVQMTLVVDERGLAVGILTMEDLVEELVGEIYDETDREVAGVRTLPDGTMSLHGGFPLRDLPDLDLPVVDSTSYTTVAGLVLDRLGRVPDTAGDVIRLDGWSLEVTEVDQHRIARVRAAVDPVVAEVDGHESGSSAGS
ncbi:MAG: hemolysin family protein [Actinomycetota bacterium]